MLSQRETGDEMKTFIDLELKRLEKRCSLIAADYDLFKDERETIDELCALVEAFGRLAARSSQNDVWEVLHDAGLFPEAREMMHGDE